ncbi:polymerase delta-interacting protein 3 isoform X2 [Hermetia illucens]|uniref:polymerase delta-interacting protein 3 isoform X2 n=1 Tax=Hermetia illucens TaxID=343691 RepID=UPI0018CC49CE|nr:polymerase delta-interacting protein 3 isoform X2 [Hermetia illucens]
MDMSLDEIIKKKKIGGASAKKGFVTKKNIRAGGITKRAKVVDARNKIIQKNRAKIRDAREKLAQITKASGDARLRLLRKRKDVSPKRWPIGGLSSSGLRPPKLSPLKTKPKPLSRKLRPQDLIGVPRGYVDYDNMEMEEAEYQPDYTALRMTVHNNMMHSRSDRMMPSMRSAGDPFDCYEVPVHRPPEIAEPLHIRRQIRNMSPDILPPPKGILRSSRQASPPPSYNRRYIPDETSHLSYEMRHRLEHAPDPNASMGIFANPLSKQSSSYSGSSGSQGCRIVVSNLHSSVTQSDIKELFEDIGELYEARLVRPGVAEVIYNTIKDAEKAVETYHNRQLDGQPMKCLLVNPRASNKPTAPAIKTSNSLSSRSSNKTPLEIDIDALHKVLFRRH